VHNDLFGKNHLERPNLMNWEREKKKQPVLPMRRTLEATRRGPQRFRTPSGPSRRGLKENAKPGKATRKDHRASGTDQRYRALFSHREEKAFINEEGKGAEQIGRDAV